ncbi:MAG: DUF6150 family protein [Coriobacteriales bacterium]|nr:DUF6150 family protein [Coriobacteriales bacterium]
MKVFAEQNEWQADLLYYIVDNDWQAEGDEKWFYVANEWEATVKIFWTPNEWEADLKVYREENEWQAKWQNSNAWQNRLS